MSDDTVPLQSYVRANARACDLLTENRELRAEIERLRVELRAAHAGLGGLQVTIENLRAEYAEAAAFLDALAERIDAVNKQIELAPIADDCRAMAARLRGANKNPSSRAGH